MWHLQGQEIKGQINFCEISNHMPYKGYIYSYERKGIYYVGSTRDLKKKATGTHVGIKDWIYKIKESLH